MSYPLSETQKAATAIRDLIEDTVARLEENPESLEERGRLEGLEAALEALREVDPDACWWEEEIPPGASLGARLSWKPGGVTPRPADPGTD